MVWGLTRDQKREIIVVGFMCSAFLRLESYTLSTQPLPPLNTRTAVEVYTMLNFQTTFQNWQKALSSKYNNSIFSCWSKTKWSLKHLLTGKPDMAAMFWHLYTYIYCLINLADLLIGKPLCGHFVQTLEISWYADFKSVMAAGRYRDSANRKRNPAHAGCGNQLTRLPPPPPPP